MAVKPRFKRVRVKEENEEKMIKQVRNLLRVGWKIHYIRGTEQGVIPEVETYPYRVYLRNFERNVLL